MLEIWLRASSKDVQCLLSIIQIKTLTVFWRKNPLRRVSVINWKQLVQFCLAVGCSLVSGNERADFACLDPQYISSYVYTVAKTLKSCPKITIAIHQTNYQQTIYLIEMQKILRNNYLYILYLKFLPYCKGQLISKCLFGAFTFLQKTNKNKSISRKFKFARSYFGRNIGLKK